MRVKAFLAPDIIRAIMNGTSLRTLPLNISNNFTPFLNEWSAQKSLLEVQRIRIEVLSNQATERKLKFRSKIRQLIDCRESEKAKAPLLAGLLRYVASLLIQRRLVGGAASQQLDSLLFIPNNWEIYRVI